MLRAAAARGSKPPGLCSRPRLAVAGRVPYHIMGTAAADHKLAAGAANTPSPSTSSELPDGVEALVRAIHADDTKAVVYVAGGASQVRRL
jgi:hypothetical protein